MRPWLNLYSYMSSRLLMDDVLCVLFYPDDSVRLEMTWFVQAVSVKMMNFVDGGWESDDNIRTSILIACVCPCLISSRLICFCFTQGLVCFSALQMDVTKQCSREYFSVIPIEFIKCRIHWFFWRDIMNILKWFLQYVQYTFGMVSAAMNNIFDCLSLC